MTRLLQSNPVFRLAAVMLLLVASCGVAEATFERLVGDDDQHPAGGTYTGLSGRVAFENNTLYYYGRDAATNRYSLIKLPVGGSPTILVDSTMTVPGGTTSSIINKSTIIPFTGTPFTSFSTYDAEGGTFMWIAGCSGYSGIFTTSDGGATFATHADNFTEMPGYAGWDFDAFKTPAIYGGDVIWRAQSAKNADDFRMEGIYGVIGGTLTNLVDMNSANPGGGGFAGIDGVSGFDNGIVLFGGSHDRTSTGDEDGYYYILPDGSVHLLIEETQTLDGKVIEDCLDASLFGNTAVVRLGFTDGTSALYYATIPEPTSALLLLVSAAAAAVLRRRWK